MNHAKQAYRKSFWAWLTVLYTLVIFTLLPFTPSVVKILNSFLSLRRMVNLALAFFFLGLLAFLLRSRKKDAARLLPYFFGYLLVAAVLIAKIRLPIERIHIPEYGLLAVFLYRTFRFDMSAREAGLASFLSGTVAGVLDEVVQLLLPNRYYQIWDIVFNAAGVLAGLLSLAYFNWAARQLRQ